MHSFTPSHRRNGSVPDPLSPTSPMSVNECQSYSDPTSPNVDNGNTAMSDFQTAPSRDFHIPTSAPSFPRTSSTTPSGTDPAYTAFRTCQSALRTWSLNTTPS